MGDPIVLLSYHPVDEVWKDRVRTRLARTATIEAWPLRDDADGEWLEGRQRVSQSAQAAVLLLSEASLASEYLERVELPRLRLRRRRGETVVALLVEPCSDLLDGALGEIPVFSLDGLALSKGSEPEIARLLDRFESELRETLCKRSESPPDTSPADLDEVFDRLYAEHYRGLVSFFGCRGLDPEVSRDLSQETMLRAYRGLGAFEGRSSPRTWILKIALHTWKNWIRDQRGTSKRGGWEHSLDEARESGFEVAEEYGLWPQTRSDPERRAVERQARELVRSRIPDLSYRQRTCLLLWLEGRTYEEITAALGVSIQTVRASLSKAKARLVRETWNVFRGSGDVPHEPLEGEGS